MNLKAKANDLVSKVRKNWSTPPKGRYMTYKEIAAYSFGGMGVYCIVTVVNAMLLSTTNILIGNTIGISPTYMYALFVASTILGIPLAALRAKMIDNTRNKKGRYRPNIMKMGIPATILAVGFVWMPYERMDMLGKGLTVLAFNIGFQFFYNFFFDSYENLIHVLSPNTQERAEVLSIKAVVYSMAPTIIGPIIPLVAGVLTDGSLTDIKLYRYVYPPFAIIGMLLSYIVYAHTKEKIVQARTHVIGVKFMDALKEVAKNKYFWIISIAGWVGFLEGAFGTLLMWLYQYQGATTANQYAVLGLVIGNASLWGMLLAPYAIRKLGKRGVLIVTNALNIVFIAIMYPYINNIWIIAVCIYMNSLAGAFSHILTPAIQGDIRDYQQYKSGERIDGMFAAIGVISSMIMMITSGILPVIYEKFGGIFEGNGFDNPYDALYDTATYTTLARGLVLMSVFGAVLNLVPFFFYDLTEVKQQGIIKILQLRALFEDFGNKSVSDQNLVDTIDMIDECKDVLEVGTLPVDKSIIKKAKKTRDKAKVKEAKREYKELLQHNEDVEIAKEVRDEMKKYESPQMKLQLSLAQQVSSSGLKSLTLVNESSLVDAKALPKATEDEKQLRKYAIKLAKDYLNSKKLAAKHYPNGLPENNDEDLYAMFDKEDALEVELTEAHQVLFEAEGGQDSASVQAEKDKKKEARAKRQAKKALKLAEKEGAEQLESNGRSKKDKEEALAEKERKKIEKENGRAEKEKIKLAKAKERAARVKNGKNKAKQQAAKVEIKKITRERSELRKDIKVTTDERALYHRIVKPYLDANAMVVQADHYEHYDDLAALYDEASERLEALQEETEDSIVALS